jgi:hypothetical protein
MPMDQHHHGARLWTWTCGSSQALEEHPISPALAARSPAPDDDYMTSQAAALMRETWNDLAALIGTGPDGELPSHP